MRCLPAVTIAAVMFSMPVDGVAQARDQEIHVTNINPHTSTPRGGVLVLGDTDQAPPILVDATSTSPVG